MTSLLLVLATCAVYWQVGNHQFVNLDDAKYILENPRVRAGLTGDGLIWAFTSTYASNWHPLTWLSHMLDVQLFGLNPGAHHLVNLLFHAVNTVLLFLLLVRMTGASWQSMIVAALFALHPLHVESVAWVAERKDVLSAFFWMLTLLLYAWYVRRQGRMRYLLTLCSFALGLLSKPMLVTLPLVLLLLDYWPLGRLQFGETGTLARQDPAHAGQRHLTWRLLWEKTPFFALAAVSSIVTLHAQQKAVASVEFVPVVFRVINALWSYVLYLGKMLWPLNLAAMYPLSTTLTMTQGLSAGLLIAGISLFVMRSAKRHPYLFVGWLWYLITLVPVIGLVQVGRQAMADRYTYLPLIGPFMMLAWGMGAVAGEIRFRRIAISSAGGLMLVALVILTWFQIRTWKDSFTLFNHAIEAVDRNYIAHETMGRMLTGTGRLDEAQHHYATALRIAPNDERSLIGMGNVLIEQGKIDEGIYYTQMALRLRPNSHYGHFNMGYALLKQGREQDALDQYAEGLRSDPENAGIHHIVGVILGAQGKLNESIEHFQKALRIQPDNADAHYGLGIALMRRGNVDESSGHFAEALRLKPDFPEARLSLDQAMHLKKKSQ
ncbi:MAG: tetratricopeptide repeat protein [Nitrospirae bacterium]|nr:tetratricopeptide repeat protein [Nitrospirota bacterium]